MTASFSIQWKDLLEDLLHRGTSAGADLVEVFLERTDHLGLLAEQDTITSVNPAFSRGAGLRVFLEGRDGFVSTNDLSPDGLTRALDQALPRRRNDGTRAQPRAAQPRSPGPSLQNLCR